MIATLKSKNASMSSKLFQITLRQCANIADPYEVSEPPTDVISSLRFSSQPNSNKFVVGSWDKFAYLYEISDDKQCKLVKKFEHQAPVLDACFGKDDDEVYTTSLDWNVRR